MPEVVTCPTCNRELRVPDNLLGKTVRCPDCQEKFTVAIESSASDAAFAPGKKSERNEGVATGRRSDSQRAAAGEEPEYDEDHPPQPYDDLEDGDEEGGDRLAGKTKKAGWKRVRLGLSLMIYGIYVEIGAFALLLLCLILGIILVVVAGAGMGAAFSAASSGGSGGAPPAIAGGAIFGAIVVIFIGYGALLLAALANLILGAIGHVFFLRIPDKPGTGRRPLAIAALSLLGAGVLLNLFYFALSCMGGFMSGSRGGSGGEFFSMAGACFNLIALGCNIAWFFVFMFFLRSVALGMKSLALARQLVTYMITVPVFCVLAVLGLIMVFCVGGAAMAGMASSGSSSTQGAAAMGTGWLIAIITVYGIILLVILGLWIWYIVLLHQVRGSIRGKYLR